MIVCDINNKDCMLQQCENCPRDDLVTNFLEGKLEDISEEITFAPWVTTNRTEMITGNQTLPVNEYLKLPMTKLMKLLSNSFIAKQQSNFF